MRIASSFPHHTNTGDSCHPRSRHSQPIPRIRKRDWCNASGLPVSCACPLLIAPRSTARTPKESDYILIVNSNSSVLFRLLVEIASLASLRQLANLVESEAGRRSGTENTPSPPGFL